MNCNTKSKDLLYLKLLFIIILSVAIFVGMDMNAYTSPNLTNGIYNNVSISMLNETKNEPSMAAGSIKSNGELEVKDGKYYLTVDFMPLKIGEVEGNVMSLSSLSTGGISNEVQILNKSENGGIRRVKFQIDPNATTAMTQFSIDAVPMTPKARISYNLNNAKKVGGDTQVAEVQNNTKSNSSNNTVDTPKESVNDSEKDTTKDTTKDNIDEAQNPTSSDANEDSRLKDGKYNVNVKLLHETEDRLSMASKSLSPKSILEVKDGKYYLTVNFSEIKVGEVSSGINRIDLLNRADWLEDIKILSKTEDGDISSASLEIDPKENAVMVKFGVSAMPLEPQARISYDLSTATDIDSEENSKADDEAVSASTDNEEKVADSEEEGKGSANIVIIIVSIVILISAIGIWIYKKK